MGSDEDDLFGSSSDEGGDTDDLIANAKEKPVATKKRLKKKAAPAAAPKKRKLPGESPVSKMNEKETEDRLPIILTHGNHRCRC